MEITLNDGTIINILLINIEKDYIDWRRQAPGPDDYAGVCKTSVELTSLETVVSEMTAALEAELVE
jgi:hypothetical protein